MAAPVLQKIKQAVTALIAADAKRGIKSRLVYLDDAVAMKSFKGKAVTNPVDPRQNKEAIDAIFKTGDPDYLMILGSIDVVPHQDMANPVFAPPDDPDKFAYGDLPYACDTPYSRDIATFKGPTRVVGRLPDLTNRTKDIASPSHLISLLRFAETFKSRPAADYAKYFGMSTFSWRKSSELSLTNIFGNHAALTIAPPGKPTHPKPRLAPLAHFINCHGAEAIPGILRREGQLSAGLVHQRRHRQEDHYRDGGRGRMLLWRRALRLGFFGVAAADLPAISHPGRPRLLRQQHDRLWPGRRQWRSRSHHPVLPAGGAGRSIDRARGADGAPAVRFTGR